MPDLVQRILGGVLAVMSFPLVAALAIAIRLESPGPALYRAKRVGSGARPFTCFKLRSMSWPTDDAGPTVTVAGDPRVTRIGRALRRSHLDELPQLWNVVRGEMRLVGPRPEDPRYVDFNDPLHNFVFSQTPGITGLAQLAFEDEAALIDKDDHDSFYRQVLLPRKLRLDSVYLSRRSTRLDLRILARTVTTVLGSAPPTPVDLEEWR